MSIDRSVTAPKNLSHRDISVFWAPLAATWFMMAAEGPFIAAIVARLPNPTLGLAAYGVAIAFAVLVEAPVIMLLSAATALVEDRVSYRRLRMFANGLNAFATSLLLIVLIPAVHQTVLVNLLGLPQDVARLTYGALWCFLPWPAAIGYRRFLQGVLIRSGRTKLVAYGTVIRLLAMSLAAISFAAFTDLSGASVGAAALSTGVVAEALAARWMARSAIAQVLGHVTATPSEKTVTAIAPSLPTSALSYREIGTFYYPLALTSLIGLAIQPMLTFFMGRATSPVESLAVFPVVHSLGFLFRAVGLSFQEAVIALLGKGQEGYAELSSFALRLGLIMSGILATIAFTPLSSVWFETISGLSPELADFAIPAIRVLSPVPFLGVWISLQRGVLVKNRTTGPITVATSAEVLTVAVVFSIVGWGFGWVGITAAFTAFFCGRGISNLYLIPKIRLATDDNLRRTA